MCRDIYFYYTNITHFVIHVYCTFNSYINQVHLAQSRCYCYWSFFFFSFTFIVIHIKCVTLFILLLSHFYCFNGIALGYAFYPAIANFNSIKYRWLCHMYTFISITKHGNRFLHYTVISP